MLSNLAAQKDLLFLLAKGQRAQLGHAVLANHRARQLRRLLDVVRRAGGYAAEESLFLDAAAHQDRNLPKQIVLRIVVAVAFRQFLSYAQRRAARDDADVDIFPEQNLARVNLQDALASPNVRTRNYDTPIKSSGSKQGRIQNVRPIRRSDQDHAVVRFKPVHLYQQLIQGLLALVMSAAEARPAMATNGVNLVNEDDA